MGRSQSCPRGEAARSMCFGVLWSSRLPAKEETCSSSLVTYSEHPRVDPILRISHGGACVREPKRSMRLGLVGIEVAAAPCAIQAFHLIAASSRMKQCLGLARRPHAFSCHFGTPVGHSPCRARQACGLARSNRWKEEGKGRRYHKYLHARNVVG